MAARKANAGPPEEKPGAELVDNSIKPQPDGVVENPEGAAQEAQGGVQERFSASGGPRTPDPADSEPDESIIETNVYDTDDLWTTPPTPETFRKVVPPPIVGKPGRNVFFRVNPDPAYTVTTKMLAMAGGERKTAQYYWVARPLWDAPVLREELVVVRLFVAKTLEDVTYLWCVKLFDEEHGSFKWTQTALICAEEAKQHYVKVVGDIGYGGYVGTVAEGDHGVPQWSTEPLSMLIKQAFGPARTITSLDHEAVKKLTGKIA